MFHLFFVVNILIGYSTASESTQDVSSYYNTGGKIGKATQRISDFHAPLSNSQTPSNVIFFQKDENQVRVPTKVYDEHKKIKKIKKSPKRTIQKIIKKGKNRSRKIYVNPITRLPTTPSKKVEIIDNDSNENEGRTTGNPRRRMRKNSKVARYPMPFHKLQSRKDLTHHRNRREAEKDDFYLLKDFDEMEFLDKGKDYNIVKTEVKKYW